MHEATVVRSLVRRASDVALSNGGPRVRMVKVRQGRMGHLSAGHLQDHFRREAAGTPLEGAELQVDIEGEGDELFLVSITVEDV